MAANAFQVQYRQEFIAAFGLRQSLLRDCVTTEAMIKGNQAQFLIVDSSGVAVTRGINGVIPSSDLNNSQVPVTLTEKHALIRQNSFNIFTNQGDIKTHMQMNAMAILNRQMDEMIIATLNTGTVNTGAAATASTSMLSKAITTLQNNGIPWDGNVYGVVTSAFMNYIMELPSFSSADYVNVKPNVSNPTAINASDPNKAGQGWYEWRGVKWITHSALPGVGTNAEKCFLFHKSAIGHAANSMEMDVQADYNSEQDYSWTRATVYNGATKLQNAGIIVMNHDGSALTI